jgi:membrane-associated phospholipid phosphatase
MAGLRDDRFSKHSLRLRFGKFFGKIISMITKWVILLVGSGLIFGLFTLVPYLWWRGKKEMALHGFLAGMVSWFGAELIKELYYFPRPYLTNGHQPVAVHVPTDGSFPSGHTAAAFGLAVSLWLHDGRWGWAALTVGLAIGIARVAAQIHYPIDILGGAVLGTVVAVVIDKLHIRMTALIKEGGKKTHENRGADIKG